MLDLSKFKEAVVLIEKAVEQGHLAGDIDAVLQARIHWVTYFWRQGLYEAAQEQSERALQLSQQSRNEQLKIWVIVQQGIIHNHLGEYDQAQKNYEQALRDYETIGIKDSTWIRVHNALGSNFILLDRYQEARVYYELALELYRQIDSLPGTALIISNLSTLDLYEQHYNQALLLAEESLAIFQEIGEVVRVSQVYITLGIIFTCLGAWETARQKLEQSLTLSRSVHNQLTVIDSLVYLALLECQLNNFEEALDMSDQALDLAKQAAVRSHQAYALTSRGWALTGLGQLEEALVSFQKALSIRQELKQLNLTAEVEANLARLYLSQNDMEQASAYVENILGYLGLPRQHNKGKRPFPEPGTNHSNPHSIRPLNGTQEPFKVYLTCYQVLEAMGDARSASILDFAANLLREQADQLDDPILKQSFLENVPVNRQILAY
jgi:tetratricopeptide (TPR) repeat protein